SRSRQVTLADPKDVFSLTSMVSLSTINGKTWQSTWDAPTHRITERSPLGRLTKTVLDDKGRTISIEAAGLATVTVSYDAIGRLNTVQQGRKITSFQYDNQIGRHTSEL